MAWKVKAYTGLGTAQPKFVISVILTGMGTTPILSHGFVEAWIMLKH